MILEPVNTLDLAEFGRRIVWAAIRAARHDASEMKRRIMITYEHGHLTFEECDLLIPALGLADA